MERAIALVTGVGRQEGIGFELCRQLGDANYHVVLTARTEQIAHDLSAKLAERGASIEGLALDVTSIDSVQELARRISAFHGRLDLLINNAAGTAHYGETCTTGKPADAAEMFDIVTLGAWRVTQAMFPLLARSAHPRVVNVSSGAGSHDDPQFGLTTSNGMGPSYGIAKTALNAYTAALAKELATTPIVVNAACPGLTATFPGAEAMGARPVAEGAASILWAAKLPDDGPRGGFFRDGRPVPW